MRKRHYVQCVETGGYKGLEVGKIYEATKEQACRKFGIMKFFYMIPSVTKEGGFLTKRFKRVSKEAFDKQEQQTNK